MTNPDAVLTIGSRVHYSGDICNDGGWFEVTAIPHALREYAKKCHELGVDAAYVHDCILMADQFEHYRIINGPGDPDAVRHRTDDPATVAEMRKGRSA